MSPVGVAGAGGAEIARRGGAMSELGVLERADVVIEGERIVAVGVDAGARVKAIRAIDAAGRVLMPGFVDAHTHVLCSGDRLDEWEMKRRGVTYLDILKAGGGIMSTVRAVRAAGESELAAGLRARLKEMLRCGTTTVEVKSGYGLSCDAEMKMLGVIESVQREGNSLPTVVGTALLGHAIDPGVERNRFIETVIGKGLDDVHGRWPRMAIDAFCEDGAWTKDECVRLFERAIALGHPIRVHADQFNSLGMVEWAITHEARSVDHLEASSPELLKKIGHSGTFAVAIPCTGFHTDGRYANMRAVVDAGGAAVVATNWNPGSSPCGSMPMAMALAVRHCGLSPAEAMVAGTVNAAALLGFTDRGMIAPGMRADLVLLRHTDERMLVYEFGGNPVDVVVAGGVEVSG